MTNLVVSRRNATVHDAFVGEGYFNLSLPIGQIEDLEDVCGCGIGAIANSFSTGNFGIKHLRHIIRLGLIGGGMDPVRAHGLVERNVKEGWLTIYYKVALLLLEITLLGVPEDPVGELQPVVETVAETNELSGQVSTSPAQKRGTRRSKSEQ